MTKVLVGMGSNIEPERHLREAAEALRAMFGAVEFSTVYRSAAVGMEGDDFLNACCLFETALPQVEVTAQLKTLEDRFGRDRSAGSWRPRTLDLDVLLYGSQVVDDELYRYAHAFVPASELTDLKLPDDDGGRLTRMALRL